MRVGLLRWFQIWVPPSRWQGHGQSVARRDRSRGCGFGGRFPESKSKPTSLPGSVFSRKGCRAPIFFQISYVYPDTIIEPPEAISLEKIKPGPSFSATFKNIIYINLTTTLPSQRGWIHMYPHKVIHCLDARYLRIDFPSGWVLVYSSNYTYASDTGIKHFLLPITVFAIYHIHILPNLSARYQFAGCLYSTYFFTSPMPSYLCTICTLYTLCMLCWVTD